MTIAVDTDVPVPSERACQGRSGKYPFEGMKDGYSFAELLDTSVTERLALQRVRGSATAWAKRRGLKDHAYIVRVVTEGGEKKVRCWLTITKKEPL